MNALERERLIVSDMPVKNVIFIIRHCINLLLKNWNRYEMASCVDQQASVRKSRPIANSRRIVESKLFKISISSKFFEKIKLVILVSKLTSSLSLKKVNWEKVSRPRNAPQTLFAFINATGSETFNSSLVSKGRHICFN